MAKLTLSLSEDGERLTFQLSEQKKALEAVFTAGELDALIRQLALIRRSIKVPHPNHPASEDSTKGVREPPWLIGERDRERLLSFLHPGFGWLNFVLAEEYAQFLSEALQQSKGTKYPDDPAFWRGSDRLN